MKLEHVTEAAQSAKTFGFLKYVTTFIGALLACWTMLGRFDAALVDHLKNVFATKADVEAVTGKIDKLDGKVDVIIQAVNPSPPSSTGKAPHHVR